MVCPPFFGLTKEFSKIKEENMGSYHLSPHFLQEGPINLIPSPDCYICNACSIDTAIWLYGYMAMFWQYGYMASKIKIKCGQYGRIFAGLVCTLSNNSVHTVKSHKISCTPHFLVHHVQYVQHNRYGQLDLCVGGQSSMKGSNENIHV